MEDAISKLVNDSTRIILSRIVCSLGFVRLLHGTYDGLVGLQGTPGAAPKNSRVMKINSCVRGEAPKSEEKTICEEKFTCEETRPPYRNNNMRRGIKEMGKKKA